MIKLKDLINESTSFTPGVKKSMYYPIVKSVIDFMNDRDGNNPKLKVMKVAAVKLGGDVEYKKTNKEFTIRVNFDQIPNLIMGTVIHEMTHVDQRLSNRLTLADSTFTWNGKDIMTFKEYEDSQLSFKEYSKLPWEAEAFKNQKDLVSVYKKSKFFTDLRGINDTLDLILDF